MDNAKRELTENLLIQAVVVGLFCAVFLLGSLANLATHSVDSSAHATVLSSTDHPYLRY
jgi:hypothetical protein